MLKTFFTEDDRHFRTTGEARILSKLPPGFYQHRSDDDKHFFDRVTENKNKVIELDEDQAKAVEQVDTFWEAGAQYAELGFQHKRGVLLYGPPGTGKSTSLRFIGNNIVRRGGVVITNPSGDAQDIVDVIRERDAEQPIGLIFEDIERWCVSENHESHLINALDGIGNADHVMYLGTTNFIKKVSDRIKDRPGRFDWLVEIGYPSERVREQFFLQIDPSLDEGTLQDLIKATKDKSIAHMREALLRKKVYAPKKKLAAAAAR